MLTTTLSEWASKQLLGDFGVPLAAERRAADADAAVAAACAIGFPVVVKLNGERIAHKAERRLVRLGLADSSAAAAAAAELLALAGPEDGDVDLLVAPMVPGLRELIVGAVRDRQFGPTVMLGVGGVLAEATADVVFRPAPLDLVTAEEMVDELRTATLLGAFRGEAAVDRAALASVLVALGRLLDDRDDVTSVDVNPLIVRPDGTPVAVDALVELRISAADEAAPTGRQHRSPTPTQFAALFEPRGVLVAGASTHPGKFGFVSLHNLLAAGYAGAVYGTNLHGDEVLGVRTVPDVAAIPDGAVDLVFVCTPPAGNADVLKACAAKGITAAFVTSAGYGEAGPTGKRAEEELVALADDLGMLLAGPNGQGVVSTPASLCAQIVAPYPPAGSIGVASQSGNFVSSFLNFARATGVGISRAVSAGNAAAVSVADYLSYFSTDPATRVGLAYLEGITDGRTLFDQLAAAASRKPLVVLKGGATAGGARAAASHTGALATDDRMFDGECRAAGITRAATVEEAFDAAATFATQPAPRGPRVAVVTTAGGWGVVTADAIAREPGLQLADLTDDLRDAIDALLPPRWSRGNPIDCAGGETRDTIPDVLRLVAEHPSIDAVIYLGIGIQSNQARMMREGRFYPDHGLARIVEFHERQDARYATAAADLSDATGKPILVATRAGDRRSRQSRTGDGAGDRPALLPEWHAGGHGARPPLARRPSPASTARSPLVSRRRGAVSPLLVLAAVILLPALALFGLWRVADGRDDDETVESLPPTTVAGAGAAPTPVLDTPLLSFRRVPGLIARDLNDDSFAAAVDGFAGTLDPTSCVVVQLDGVEVGAHNPDLPVIPASNQKLLVAAAALDVLGADHVFTTDVRAAGVNGGVVPGDLYLVGGGDPLLTSAEYPVDEFDDYPVTSPTSLDALADAVAAAGDHTDPGQRHRRRLALRRRVLQPQLGRGHPRHRGRPGRRVDGQRRPRARRRVPFRRPQRRRRPRVPAPAWRRAASPSPATPGAAQLLQTAPSSPACRRPRSPR